MKLLHAIIAVRNSQPAMLNLAEIALHAQVVKYTPVLFAIKKLLLFLWKSLLLI